ncbi:MAG: Gfo/Idh/MocA family oxidoreductase [Leptolyngbyaceae bacterium]|nr:Gfo/Idh/MocA family oxidoreductase [Leptolyngbyaceae bacterium]
MAQTSLGIGIVGTGFGQKIHIPGFQEHPKTNIVAVYHRDAQTAKAIAQTHNIPHACTTVSELANLSDVDAVSISTPPFLHAEMAKEVIAAGKHLLVEKPTAMNVAEAKELLSLAEAAGIVTCLDFEFRYVPEWMRLFELLEDGYVGQKRLMKIDWLASGRANPERAWNWYSQAELGGGAIGAFGSHTFDYIAWLFGPVARLCSTLSTGITERPDANGNLKPVNSDDTCQLWLELADGTPCQVVLSSVTYQGRGHWVEVYGDRGTLVLGNENQKDYVHGFQLWASEQGDPLVEQQIPERLKFAQTYPDGRLAPFIRVVDHWVKDIEQGRSSAPSLKEGVYSQLLMDAAYDSHRRGAWVTIPQDEF